MGFERSLAAARHPGTLSGHVRRSGAQIQKYRTVGPDIASLRGQNGRLRPLFGVRHRKSPSGHFSRYPQLIISFKMTIKCKLKVLIGLLQGWATAVTI